MLQCSSGIGRWIRIKDKSNEVIGLLQWEYGHTPIVAFSRLFDEGNEGFGWDLLDALLVEIYTEKSRRNIETMPKKVNKAK